jgi:hypothetical protein
MAKPMSQVKFTIEADIVSAFKARCASEGVSMASAIRQFMSTCKPAKNPIAKPDTRPQRKKAVMEYVGLLGNILQREEAYRDAIPEQFESRYEAADQACEQLGQAISCLEDAF